MKKLTERKKIKCASDHKFFLSWNDIHGFVIFFLYKWKCYPHKPLEYFLQKVMVSS